ncbi:hypothetical protein P8452_09097 [Trifolium repens]|nr:hypothetical protein P8452_09097 [Trifolium repens]
MADSSTNPKDHQNTRLYHPYQHLNIPVDKLYNLPTSPEHLFPEEASRKHRSWGDNLQYYTGTGYLSGAIIGGAKGTVEGLKAAESGLESSMIHFRDTDDFVNSAVAGLGTGALYKAATGPRSAAIAGAIGGIAAAVAVVGKQALKRHIPI